MEVNCCHDQYLVSWDGFNYIYICKSCQKEFTKNGEAELEEVSAPPIGKFLDASGQLKRNLLTI